MNKIELTEFSEKDMDEHFESLLTANCFTKEKEPDMGNEIDKMVIRFVFTFMDV